MKTVILNSIHALEELMGKLFNFFSGHNKEGKGVTKKQVEFDKKVRLGFP